MSMAAVIPFPSADVFIETGLSEGRTLQALAESGRYRRLHSIDLHAGIVAAGRTRFAAYSAVTIHEGSSADILPRLCDPSVSTVFWLDAHTSPTEPVSASGACPLLAELAAIIAMQLRRSQPAPAAPTARPARPRVSAAVPSDCSIRSIAARSFTTSMTCRRSS